METFKASNGVAVKRNPDDGPDCDYQSWMIGNAREVLLAPHEIDALREFFQNERDQELGRWRFPRGSIGYVVYPKVNGSVRVVEEITGQSEVVTRESVNDDLDAWWNEVADAYFAAHPVPKPAWHTAKPGEVWVLERLDELAAWGVVERLVHPNTFVDPQARRPSFPVTDELIVSARRIWPEAVPCE